MRFCAYQEYDRILPIEHRSMADQPLNLKQVRETARVSQHPAVAGFMGGSPSGSGGNTGFRPWLGVHFVCASKYVRVYREPDGSRYIARCPSCGRSAIFRVGQGGTSSRQFEVSCH